MADKPRPPSKVTPLQPVRLPPLRDFLDSFPDPLVVVSRNHQVIAANEAFLREYHPGQSVVGRTCYDVSHNYNQPCDQVGEDCPLKESLRTGQLHRVLHVHHTPRGHEHIEVETLPIRSGEGEPEYFMEIHRRVRGFFAEPGGGPGLVGRSPAFNRMLELIQRVAPTETAVLLLGESGTGKELAAQAIHLASPRAQGPFVPVECSGLTESLFESELFGHVKGAFTGAQSQKTGLVEAARGGTLFLDEVGDVPLGLQVKLLRLLETRSYRRVGDVESQNADFRLICATHRGIKDMVNDGSFRRDLYYRLSTFPIQLPALRERREDLPLLVHTLLRRIAPARRLHLDRAATDCLLRYPFPGNIRELRNILERASLLADGEVIQPDHLPEICETVVSQAEHVLPRFHQLIPLEELERAYLRWATARFPGSRRELAQQLGVSERTLYRKLTQMGEEIPDEEGEGL